MSQSLRLGGSLLGRLGARSIPATRRAFNVSAVSRADIIQDMYLKELKAYKAPPQKASDSEGLVQKFSPPSVPKSPEETNLASDMSEYENQTVEVGESTVSGETQAASEDDYFEDLKQFDEEEKAHH